MFLEKTYLRSLFFLIVLAVLTASCKSKKISREDPVFTVISTAKSFTGTPYKYGGTTRAGMDCSALVFHSFYAVGITMPRISADQAKMGKKVSREVTFGGNEPHRRCKVSGSFFFWSTLL